MEKRHQPLLEGSDASGPSSTTSDPGRLPATARIARGSVSHTTNYVFRVESAEAARELAGMFGPRDANGVAGDANEAVDRASRSSGAPLPEALRGQFEQSLGADLSSVRLHTGTASQEAARAVGARAYTLGQDIHFGAGQYDPSTSDGQFLVAHEVAHTVQQQGGAPVRQHKLEVSAPGDAAEVEADHAAEAMVAGRPAQLDGTLALSRKILRDAEPPGADTGSLEGAGDEAEARARKVHLQVDTAAVTVDKKDASELIADIDKHGGTIHEAEKEDADYIEKFHASDVNAATKTALQIFDDKLATTSVDTTGFAIQFRTAYADYERLSAEAVQLMSALGVEGGIDEVSDGFAEQGKSKGLHLDEAQVGLERFRRARQTLNGAASKMRSEATAFRGASQGLQGALYAVKAKAAAVKGAEAKKKLAALRSEIDGVAKGVGTAAKLATALITLEGGGGALSKAQSGALEKGASLERLEMAKAIYGDAGKLVPGELGKVELVKGISLGTVLGGDPAAMAEALAKCIGEHANKEKLNDLATQVSNAAAEEKEFSAAGDAQQFAGYQTNMEAAALRFKELLSTYKEAKQEMTDAGQALMDQLDKQGPKGKNQAKAVLFLTDADRFLAQAKTAISTGEHQQANAKNAAADRKALRGTDEQFEDKYRETMKYYRCTKITKEGVIWDDTIYRFTKVDVTFTNTSRDEFGPVDQGGGGSVEGAGGAADVVAQNLERLRAAEKQVQVLQANVQSAVGLKGPGKDA